MRVLIWFHRDLRTHDHAGLAWALAKGYQVTGVAFSPASRSSPAKLGFWRETANELRLNLETTGIPLHISDKDPWLEIPNFVIENQIDKVITHRRMNARDQRDVECVTSNISIELLQLGDTTLFSSDHASELTLSMLKPFTRFKNHAMKHWTVPDEEPGFISLKRFDENQAEWSAGGETAGLARLQNYAWETRAALHYHETRNGMIERDDSSKFSRWLAWGALSPRRIYWELRRLELETGPEEGISSLIYELVWRDYFKFLAYLTKDAFFSKQGLRSTPLEYENDDVQVDAWRQGQTGNDFVDANMRELLSTGWMSNRGRQNVASYFAKTAQLDWTLGAKWFEDQLVDEDPENNWGNWQYISGVGTDPRDRKFDTERQATHYDPEGRYRNIWLKT